jgi:pimeloyl-ACP methyl ester carboxylesterase
MADAKAPIADSGTNVRRWKHALFNEPTPLDAFSRLRIPVLYLIGERTTASARGVAKLLVPALRRVEFVELEELGHMAPVTHPDKVNDRIQGFLERIG